MTTKHSPPSVLKRQADQIAATLKKAERGEKIDARFAEKVAAARAKEGIKVGVVMDDKVITLDLPWATIRGTTEAGLSEYILRQMQEVSDAGH